MRSSKIYSILEHFDKYEQNRFRKYICSPYFNKDEKLVLLFELMITDTQGKKRKPFEKQDLWKKLQPDKSYDDVRFRKYCSDLLKLVESFLSQQIYESNPLHKVNFLMQSIDERKMEGLFRGTIRSARRISEQRIHKPASHYYYQYEIEKNLYYLTGFELKRSMVSNVEAIANNLDVFYIAEKLRYLCLVLSRQYQVSHEYQLLFIEEIINHIKKYDYESISPVAVYYQVYLALSEDDKLEHYFKLKKLLEKHGRDFPTREASSIYTYALNYCTRKINKGHQNFLEEIFDLYLDLLDKKIILPKGEMVPGHFQNIVTVALRLGKFSWTEEFIFNYAKVLPEESRENMTTYNLAQLYFYEKKYHKVIEQLQNVEYTDVTYSLRSKSMLLATYYELDEIDPLYHLLDSFKVYLNRHKEIAEHIRVQHQNLIRYTKRLIKILPSDRKAVDKLSEEIHNKKDIANAQWLRQKVAELV
ncbi:MAG: hypothetical protein KTR30_34130 [Saprospiraceae bacterium]|nr:hypothetical protein [Saprospiraceae bacterium]